MVALVRRLLLGIRRGMVAAIVSLLMLLARVPLMSTSSDRIPGHAEISDRGNAHTENATRPGIVICAWSYPSLLHC